MRRDEYEKYLACFNAKDYDGVLEFWTSEFEAKFAGVVLRNGADLKGFYSFFHSYVKEQISVLDFVSDEGLAALRATVRLTGIRDLTKDALEKAGYGGLIPLTAGQSVELSQVIMYRLKDGRFTQVYCGLM